MPLALAVLLLRAARSPLAALSVQAPAEAVDVVVIGSGIGGLSCAALAAKYGMSVACLESHSIPGGCAHSFEREGFTFDSGPSLWAGMSAPSVNPLRQVLDAVGEGETVELSEPSSYVRGAACTTCTRSGPRAAHGSAGGGDEHAGGVGIRSQHLLAP